MNTDTVVPIMGGHRTNAASQGADGVVEIGLLLPAKRAAALIRLAKDRRESVGQVLRKLIEKEIAESL